MVEVKQDEKQYLTKEGDLVDRICWDYYGTVDGVTEAVYLRNEALLAKYGAILPGGLLLVLPTITKRSPGIRLWNYRDEDVFKPSRNAAERGASDALAAYQAASFRGSGRTLEVDTGQLIKELRTEFQDADSAFARRLLILNAEVNGNFARITIDQQVSADLYQTVASQLSEFTAHFGDNIATLSEEILVSSSATEALAREVTRLSVNLGSDIRALLETEIQTRVDEHEALAERITSLQAVFESSYTSLRVEERTRATEDEALVEIITTLDAQLGNSIGSINQQLSVLVNAQGVLVQNVSSLSATLSTKNKTFSRNTPPTNPDDNIVPGDLWFDTAHNNQAYRWNGNQWVATSDTRIDQNYSELSGRIDNVVTLNLSPSSAILTRFASMDASLSTFGNRLTTATGRITDIENLTLSPGSALLQRLNSLQASVSGGNKTFRQPLSPTNPADNLIVGDLWFNTSDHNKPYRWDGTDWVPTDDTTISANYSEVSGRIDTILNLSVSPSSAFAQRFSSIDLSLSTKIQTFAQSSPPVESEQGPFHIGDIWFATGTGKNAPFRWGGATWSPIRDGLIASNMTTVTGRIDAIENLTLSPTSVLATRLSSIDASLITKVKSFYQLSAPANPADNLLPGDLWFDHDGKVHRWSGTAWVDVSDARIDANYSEVSGRINDIVTLNLSPTSALLSRITALEGSVSTNDYTAVVGRISAIENLTLTSTSALIQRFQTIEANLSANGGDFSAVNARIAAVENLTLSSTSALMQRFTTIEGSVSGKVKTYRQSTAPSTGLTIGDVWYNTADNNKPSRWDGTMWVAIDDARVGLAVGNLSTVTGRVDAIESLTLAPGTALATRLSSLQVGINSRNKTFRQDTAPANPGDDLFVGDLWFDTAHSNQAYRWSGAGWDNTTDTRITSNYTDLAGRITNIQDLTIDPTSLLARSITTLQSQVSIRGNLLPNGGFEQGTVGWTNNYGTVSGLQVVDDDFGRSIRYTAGTGDALIQSFPINVTPGQWYTITADSAVLSGSPTGFVYVDVGIFDMSGSAITYTPQKYYPGLHTFDTNTRDFHAFEVQAPSNAHHIVIRLAAANLNGLVAFRRVKMERGRLPYTPYTAEATDSVIGGTVTQHTSLISNIQGQIHGTWAVSIDTGKRVTGLRLSDGTDLRSVFEVLADNFYVSSASSPSIKPFSIVTGVGGAPEIIIGAPLRSTNFVAGLGGDGYWLNNSTGDAEFNRITLRNPVVVYSIPSPMFDEAGGAAGSANNGGPFAGTKTVYVWIDSYQSIPGAIIRVNFEGREVTDNDPAYSPGTPFVIDHDCELSAKVYFNGRPGPFRSARFYKTNSVATIKLAPPNVVAGTWAGHAGGQTVTVSQQGSTIHTDYATGPNSVTFNILSDGSFEYWSSAGDKESDHFQYFNPNRSL